jgi:hypothetical protein
VVNIKGELFYPPCLLCEHPCISLWQTFNLDPFVDNLHPQAGLVVGKETSAYSERPACDERGQTKGKEG